MTSHLAAALLSASALAGNWPQWRGPHLNGISDEKDLPLKWSQSENVTWKLELPGVSGATPIVWGDLIPDFRFERSGANLPRLSDAFIHAGSDVRDTPRRHTPSG